MRLFLVFLMIQINISALMCQEQDVSALKRIIDATDSLNNLAPLEKIYIHTDRNTYLIGDTIWFKAYVFDASSLSPTKNSALLFLELHDDDSEVIRRFSIKIKEGIGYAQLGLDNEIFKEGGYTLRAYTNWMNNFPPEHTFSKRIYIGKVNRDSWVITSDIKISPHDNVEQLNANIFINDIDKNPVGLRDVLVEIAEGQMNRYRKTLQTDMKGFLNFNYKFRKNADQRNMSILIHNLRKDASAQTVRIPLNTKRISTIDLQFLPEGGNLVAGLKSQLAFKAITDDGKGTDVEGIIVNQDNRTVASFSSFHNGMGSFAFLPQAAEKYIAKVTKPVGVKKSFSLPVVQSAGTILHVENNSKDSITVYVNASPGAVDATNSLVLICSSNGANYFAQRLNMINNPIKIAKRLFPSGIVRFSLLKDSIPLNERIIFIDHNDALTINIEPNIQAGKDSVNFQIKVNDALGRPVSGTFSLSVTDNSAIDSSPINNFDIRISLLLNAELKGELENPGYYFSNNSRERSQALDLLMLTQGWVGFRWKDVFSPMKLKVQSEKPGNVVHIKQMFFDKTPFLRLNPWYLNGDSSRYAFAKTAMPYNAYWSPDGLMLKEVKIRGRKRDYNGVNRNGVGYADIVLDTVEIQLSKTKGLYDLLNLKVPGLKVEQEYDALSNYKGYNLRIGQRWVRFQLSKDPHFMLFLKKTPQDLKNEVNKIKVNSVMLVEVMYTSKYLNTYFPPQIAEPFQPGVKHKRIQARAKAGLAFQSHEKDYAIIAVTGYKKKNKDINPLSLEVPRDFYVPKFGVDSAGRTIRPATIFWQPNIVTDGKGSGSVSFLGRGLKGKFSVNVQGSDMQGSIGSAQKTVSVNK